MSERNQIMAAGAAILQGVNWDKVRPQDIIEAGNQGRLGPALTEWLAERSWIPECPPPITIDRSQAICQLGPWPVWLGPVDGDGLNGEPDQDPRSTQITLFDSRKAVIVTGLIGDETIVTGEQRRLRIRAGKIIPIDFHTGWSLCQEQGQKCLRYLHERYGVCWIETDTVLRGPNGYRYSRVLYRHDDGSWVWRYFWLDGGRNARNPALGLAIST